jgi:hypothetical protein
MEGWEFISSYPQNGEFIRCGDHRVMCAADGLDTARPYVASSGKSWAPRRGNPPDDFVESGHLFRYRLFFQDVHRTPDSKTRLASSTGTVRPSRTRRLMRQACEPGSRQRRHQSVFVAQLGSPLENQEKKRLFPNARGTSQSACGLASNAVRATLACGSGQAATQCRDNVTA